MRRPIFAVLLLAACLLTRFGSRGQDTPISATPSGGVASAPTSGSVVPRLIRFAGVISPQLLHSGEEAATQGEAQNTAPSTAITITFSLYELQEGDAPLWSESQVVQVDAQGHYTALLGANTPGGLPLDLFTSGAARWLGVQP